MKNTTGFARMLTRPLLLALPLLALSACTTTAPITTEARVDIPRFMGRWHVIAHIPAYLEREAFNATETYVFEPPNVVRTTFRFNQAAFAGPVKTYHPTGFVDFASGGGLWGMQFIWPVRAEFRIVHVSPDYSQTIIGRTARDYVWIMARSPVISDTDYQALLERVRAAGYDLSALRRVPQQP